MSLRARSTVRLRLTLLYAGLFVLSGAGKKEETSESESSTEPADAELSTTSVSPTKEVDHV